MLWKLLPRLPRSTTLWPRTRPARVETKGRAAAGGRSDVFPLKKSSAPGPQARRSHDSSTVQWGPCEPRPFASYTDLKSRFADFESRVTNAQHFLSSNRRLWKDLDSHFWKDLMDDPIPKPILIQVSGIIGPKFVGSRNFRMKTWQECSVRQEMIKFWFDFPILIKEKCSMVTKSHQMAYFDDIDIEFVYRDLDNIFCWLLGISTSSKGNFSQTFPGLLEFLYNNPVFWIRCIAPLEKANGHVLVWR